VAGDHHGSAGLQSHFDGRHGSADARVFGDFTGVVQGHVQVGTDENTLSLGLALGAQIGEADDVHGKSDSKVAHTKVGKQKSACILGRSPLSGIAFTRLPTQKQEHLRAL
jgi:hypothetical protein